MTINKFNPLPKPLSFSTLRYYYVELYVNLLGKLMSLWWIFYITIHLVCAFFASLHVIDITIEAQPYFVFFLRLV